MGYSRHLRRYGSLFYINYMECKLCYFNCMNYFIYGFILTIWNVNIFSIPSLNLSFTCFILTIWNVNSTEVLTSSMPPACFILTIWNVN